MTYMAFYADCNHQVSTQTSGHRVALVYHLTAHPRVPKPFCRTREKIEFLGNGMLYPDRCYSRSVILLWPKEHRKTIAFQSKGGLGVKTRAEEKEISWQEVEALRFRPQGVFGRSVQ